VHLSFSDYKGINYMMVFQRAGAAGSGA